MGLGDWKMATKERAESRTKVYSIPVRNITANTNPRQALSSSLDSQGWTVFEGEKAIWPLAVSDNPDDRATFVRLIQDFDPDLAAMAGTLATQGQLQAVEVREGGTSNGKTPYTLVFGCRRCLAILFNWCLTGKPKEPVVNATLIKGNEGALLQRAIVENIRKQPAPVEEARTIKMLINLGQTKEEVARDLGYSKQTLSNRLKLLDLDPETQRKIDAGKMTVAKAMEPEKNGADHEGRPKIRSRKEIEAAVAEYAEHTKERKVLDWILGLREKIG